MNVLTALAAILPCVALVWHVQRRTAWEHGASALRWTFLLGALSTFAVLATAPLLSAFALPATSPYTRGLATALVRAALPEESVKLLVVAFALARGHVRDVRSGIAHGLAASLGLAAVESALFALTLGPGAAVLRVFTAVPFHAGAGAILGALAGRASRWPGSVALRLAPAFCVATALHTLYDFPLLVLSESLASATPRGAAESCALALSSVCTLAATALAGFRTWRAEFPPAPRTGFGSSARFAMNLAGSGFLVWVLVPFGGAVASAGASIVGSLLVFAPATDPRAERVVAGFHLLGVALVCIGMALGSMGLRARHPASVRA